MLKVDVFGDGVMKRFRYLLPQTAFIILFSGCNFTEHELRIIETGFLYGIIISVLIFYLLVSLLGLKSRYHLYFSALLLLGILCSDSYTNSFLMRFVNPGITRVIIYSSKAWILFFLTAYLHEFFKPVYSVVILRAVLALTILQQLYILFAGAGLSPESPINYVLNAVYGLEFLSCLYIILYGLFRKQRDALTNLFGLLIIVASYYNKALFQNPDYKYLMYAALFLFLFLQLLSAARRIKKFYNEKVNAELRFLHAQIKPHYIFNALNTIISISRYNAERALELLRDFGVYLQNSFNLKTENQFTSLKDELEIVNVYLNIEKARFEERIEVEMDLPERQDILVPVCMLQPIVENAIVHGILGKPEGGKIYIGIEQEGQKLVFTVRDNGLGMPEEKVVEILESDNIGHIGLSNIHKRLKALYKNGLTIKSKPGEGTEVTWEVLLNA